MHDAGQIPARRTGTRSPGLRSGCGLFVDGAEKERVERIAGIAGLTVKEGHLILETSAKALAASMQRFLETAKMIGDVYLVHKNRVDPENILIPEIRHALDNEHLPYVEKERLRGRIEAHSFDLL